MFFIIPLVLIWKSLLTNMEIPHGNYVFGIIFALCKKCNENNIQTSLMILHSLALFYNM